MDDRRPDYKYGQMQRPYQQPQPMTYAHPQPLPGAVPASVLDQTQKMTSTGFKPLSKEEREEAARIALEAGFSFDGYQVVRREFFSHRFDPTLTIKGNSITFNNACISRLEQVIYVQVLVNPTAEKLVIRPCSEGARDAIRWCVTRDDKRKSRQITCGLFTAKLYDMMGWEALYRYKLQGTRINYQGEQLYVFDLTSTEAFLPQVKETDENGTVKRKKAVPMYPADWRDSFGIPVQEHTASTQINLLDGCAEQWVGAGDRGFYLLLSAVDRRAEDCERELLIWVPALEGFSFNQSGSGDEDIGYNPGSAEGERDRN